METSIRDRKKLQNVDNINLTPESCLDRPGMIASCLVDSINSSLSIFEPKYPVF